MNRFKDNPRKAITFRRLAYGFLPVLAWMAVIFWFSSQSNLPSSPEPFIEVLTKKSAHMAEYAILALLLLRAIAPQFLSARRSHFLVAWAIALIYAVSDEFHQSLTPHRTPSPLDVMIDAAGAASGLMIVARWRRLFTRLQSRFD